MFDREFIKARIGDGGVGISYAEFSYSLIQGYDFLHLYHEKGATLQVGGSDQWGNMLSGAQMIKKLEGVDVHVWTVPLVVDKTTGKKYGKSEGNAIWLDPELTSPYRFYQFWLNTDDDMAKDLVKLFTFLEKSDIERLIAKHDKAPHLRQLQKRLAYETTALVHGDDKATAAENVSAVLFGDTPFEQLLDIHLDMLAQEIPVSASSSVVNALVTTGVCASNGEARRLIAGGGVSVNGQKISEDRDVAAPSLIKKGKKNFVLVR